METDNRLKTELVPFDADKHIGCHDDVYKIILKGTFTYWQTQALVGPRVNWRLGEEYVIYSEFKAGVRGITFHTSGGPIFRSWQLLEENDMWSDDMGASWHEPVFLFPEEYIPDELVEVRAGQRFRLCIDGEEETSELILAQSPSLLKGYIVNLRSGLVISSVSCLHPCTSLQIIKSILKNLGINTYENGNASLELI